MSLSGVCTVVAVKDLPLMLIKSKSKGFPEGYGPHWQSWLLYVPFSTVRLQWNFDVLITAVIVELRNRCVPMYLTAPTGHSRSWALPRREMHC